jgi:succinyl-diaminopimelate desuccinylase
MIASDIDQFLKAKHAEQLRFARELVQINSVNGNERAVAEPIAALLKRYGIRSQLVGSSRERKTLVADIGRASPTIMLNGHLDTVPFGDLEKWRYHPLAARVVGGRIYGRGTMDMKCSVAALCYAAIALKECDFQGIRIRLVFNYDEESGNHAGIRDVLKRGIGGDYCIVGEFMSEGTVRVGARGLYRFELITHGSSGHTAYHRRDSVNAVTKMAKLLLALEGLKLSYRPHKGFSAPRVNPGTVISGGTAINCFPESCSALVDCRLTLGQKYAEVKREILACLESVRRSDKKLRYSVKELGFLPAYRTATNELIVSSARQAVNDVLEAPPRIEIGQGASDSNLLSEAGIPCIELGVLGAGAHAENEYALVQSLYTMPRIYARIITRMNCHMHGAF